MNNALKRLIRRRQKALANNNLAEYKQLRNKVNRDRKACRAKYYDAKVKALKACKPPGGGGTPIHYLYGYMPPKGVVILKLLI